MSFSTNDEKSNDEVDYLDVDREIPGQKFVLLSFLDPEEILKSRDKFACEMFIDSLKNDDGDVTIKAEDFAKKFEDFSELNSEEINSKFHEKNNFRTSMRGIKVRGVYSTHEEAALKATELQRNDKNFHVFMGNVGYWLPFNPKASAVGDQVYREKELNELMREYKNNAVERDLFYNKQVESAKLDAAKKVEEAKKKQLEVVVEEEKTGVEEEKTD